MKTKNSLPTIWNSALEKFSARKLFDAPRTGSTLCWGKFAYATWKSIQDRVDCSVPHLVIAPEESLPMKESPWATIIGAEHPLPGPGSFLAGKRLLSFFNALERYETPSLTVYLSGGSSSLAWLRKGDESEPELLQKLEALYQKPWSIQKLNAARTRLCGLKGGGTAARLKELAPKVYARTQVIVVSDVAPFGPEVIGSGPFWDGHLHHQVVADNRLWVSSLTANLQKSVPVLFESSAQLGSWKDWVRLLSIEISRALVKKRSGWILMGGEPSVDLRLPYGLRPGRGGRQSQIALALLERFGKEVAAGQVEFLCGSTDGVDGRSGSSGSWICSEVLKNLKRDLRADLARFNSGAALARVGALLKEAPGGVNLQDAVLIRIRP